MSQHSLRIQKILEDANLKLGSVLSDVLGRSALAMLEAIIKGESDAEKLALVTAAWAAVRTKNSYLQAQFLRIKSRCGAKKAILAVAASMLTAAFFTARAAPLTLRGHRSNTNRA